MRDRRRSPRVTRRGAAAGLCVVLCGAAAGMGGSMMWMPGASYRGELPPLTGAETALRDDLARDVGVLAGEIGERHVGRPGSLRSAARFLEASFAEAGYEVRRQPFDVLGRECVNLVAELPGATRAGEIVVIGGHYDTVPGCPGANDNGTGAAATLALARALRGDTPARTIRFALFVNEEPPWFQTSLMGSRVYAGACGSNGDDIVAMLSLETIGCYSDEEGSQRYPLRPIGLFYPSRGDFIAFVGNYSSRRLVRRAIGAFRRHAKFPSQGGALPGVVPGVGWSDHWSFWQEGYPALMVTDTAPYRYPHYHLPTDTPDRIDYDRMARVVSGLEAVVRDLAGE